MPFDYTQGWLPLKREEKFILLPYNSWARIKWGEGNIDYNYAGEVIQFFTS